KSTFRLPHSGAVVAHGRATPTWLRRTNHSKKRFSRQLFAETEFLNNGLIAVGIVCLEVVQQATPLADQHEKTAARTVVFLVRFEVLRQLPNTLAQQRDLDFRTARVGGVRAVLVNEGSLLLSG